MSWWLSDVKLGDTVTISLSPGPNCKDSSALPKIEYTITDVWPNGAVVMEAKHGVRVIEFPDETEVVQKLVNAEWV